MKVEKLWFADEQIFIETDTGEQLSQSLKWYPRLTKATDAQRKAYRLSPMGIHWADIDEDVSFESFYYKDDEIGVKHTLFFTKFRQKKAPQA